MARWVRTHPWPAYAISVALLLSVASSAVAAPAERHAGVLDVVLGALIVYSVVATLAILRLLKVGPGDAVLTRGALGTSAATFGLGARFVTGSVALTWAGFAASAAVLAVVAAQARD